MKLIQKPKPGEYPAYADMYMRWLPDDGLVLQHLEDNFRMVKEFILQLPSAKLLHRYAPGKWTIKEILVHIVDDERIFAYRAMAFARNEKQSLPGFDQDSYAFYSGANDRPLENIFDEYELVRKSTIAMFNGLPDDSFMRMGTGSTTFHRATVRALAYHIAGHEMHHINFIKEHYL
jgi:hypothetical protein